ncbi:MAG: hypothetical protein PVI21_03820 [Candidatus Woesebacteria bacterium]|jgi:hypothetical protein
MARLPISGSDSGVWGDVLNEFLLVSHASGGTLKSGSVSDDTVASGAAIAQSKISGLSTSLAAKADDSAVMHLTGDESVAGVKTYSSSPVVPTPVSDTDAANKTYVDNSFDWDQILKSQVFG